MTPGMYIALARDIGIALALSFLVWRIYGAGGNAVKASDLKSLQAQITEQSQILASWHQESTNASDQLSRDLASLHAPVADKPPIWLCNAPPSPRSQVLPAAPASTGGADPGARGADEGRRRDIRVQVESLKLKYETALAECRAVIAQWPR